MRNILSIALRTATVVVLLAFPSAASAVVLQPEQELGGGLDPEIAAHDQNVSVVWRSPNPGDGAVCSDSGACYNDIFSRGSVDGGQNFGTKANVSADADSSLNGSVASSGSNVYVAWESASGSPPDVYFKRSTDGGATFGDVVNVSANAGWSQYPIVAAEGSNVYVLWLDDMAGNLECFFRRSTDFGASFGPIINLSASATNACGTPSISLTGGAIYVAWGEVVKRVRRSTDGGAMFEAAYAIAAPAGSQVVFSGGNAYAAWYEQVERNKKVPSNLEVFFARSADGGARFSQALNLSGNATQSRYPHIALTGANVYVAWQDDASSRDYRSIDRSADLFLRESTTDGLTFDAPVLVSDEGVYHSIDNTRLKGSFDLGVAAGNVYLAWWRYATSFSDPRVYLRRGA